jgi:HK97 gp10 family phage protein
MISMQLDGYDELLRILDRIDETLSGKVVRECVQAACEVVEQRAKQLVPVGDSADKPDLKPLRETIGSVVRGYGERTLGVIGPMLPAGAHGHNVEFGHAEVLWGVRTGRRVPPSPFMRRAFDETQQQQLHAMSQVIARTLRELGA